MDATWACVLVVLLLMSILLVVGILVQVNDRGGDDVYPRHRLRYLCINLQHRRYKYEKLRRAVPDLELFSAVNGRDLDVHLYKRTKLLTTSYTKHLENNPKQMGHLGATFSHVGVLQLICDEPSRTVVLEDDSILPENFKTKVQECVYKMDLVDPEWDILQLGFSCKYDSYDKCHLNDNIKIQAGCIIKLGYAIGLFGYVINGSRAAQRVLNHVFPISWHIDHFYQTLNLQNKIRLYATIPNIVFHPGKMEISSFKEIYDTPTGRYISDTNL